MADALFFEVIVLYTLKTSAAFDSAHFLAGYNGKCSNIHGHRWVIEVKAVGSELQKDGSKRGMLIDFSDLKEAVKTLADSFDHALIYEKGSLKEKTINALNEENFRMIELDCRPTAENLAELFFRMLKKKGIPVTSVAVYETPENCAVYGED